MVWCDEEKIRSTQQRNLIRLKDRRAQQTDLVDEPRQPFLLVLCRVVRGPLGVLRVAVVVLVERQPGVGWGVSWRGREGVD